MNSRHWLAGMAAGSLMLFGAITAGPIGSLAQQDATPAIEVSDDDGEAAAIVGTPLLRPSIDLIRAQEIALEGQDNAAVTGIELDGDDGMLVYSVALDNGIEVDVDATSGEVIKSEPIDDDEEDGEIDNGEDDQEDADESGDTDDQDDGGDQASDDEEGDDGN